MYEKKLILRKIPYNNAIAGSAIHVMLKPLSALILIAIGIGLLSGSIALGNSHE